MILAFNPAFPNLPGRKQSVPSDWIRYIIPCTKSEFFVEDFGAVLIQQLVSVDYAIFNWTFKIKRNVCLYPVAINPTIALQFTTEGNILYRFNGFGQKPFENGSYEMIYLPAGLYEAWFEQGMHESLHIELQPIYFRELIAIHPEFADLVENLNNAAGNWMNMAVAPMNYITRAILQNLKTCIKTGASLQLEVHKYILELLSEYFAAISKIKNEEVKRGIHQRKKMEEIGEYILSEPNIHIHTLERLARHFGVSVSMLKRGFKNNFNTTVSKFVRFHALKRSHYLLTTTQKSIDEIASDIGYSWRPAFEDAFKKFFKNTPARVRKDLNP